MKKPTMKCVGVLDTKQDLRALDDKALAKLRKRADELRATDLLARIDQERAARKLGGGMISMRERMYLAICDTLPATRLRATDRINEVNDKLVFEVDRAWYSPPTEDQRDREGVRWIARCSKQAFSLLSKEERENLREGLERARDENRPLFPVLFSRVKREGEEQWSSLRPARYEGRVQFLRTRGSEKVEFEVMFYESKAE